MNQLPTKKKLTWNIREKDDRDNKYLQIILDLIKGGYCVIALQEAEPHDFLPNTTPKKLTNPDDVDGSRLSVYKWRLRPANGNIKIFEYFLNYDDCGHNLAILSASEADEVILLQQPWWELAGKRTKRTPVMGIRIANDYIFNIHANGFNGSNAPDLVRRVRTFMIERRDAQSWMIMGDFNREPESLQKALSEKISKDVIIKCPENPTFVTAIRDYAVFDAKSGQDMKVIQPKLPFAADHSPVGFVLREEEEEELNIVKKSDPRRNYKVLGTVVVFGFFIMVVFNHFYQK